MNKAQKFCLYIVLTTLITALVILAGCSSNADQTIASSQSSEESKTSREASSQQAESKPADGAVFFIKYPVEPTYESTTENGVHSETYTAKTDDCYVLATVDHVNLDLQGENPYDFAANITYSFLSKTIDTSVAEEDIEKGTFDGCPAGYITLDSQDGGSFAFASSILGDGYVLNLFVKANAKERLDELVNSLSLKPSKKASAGEFVAENAGFSIAFPGAPEYSSAVQEVYGYECTNESWYEEANSGMYMVTCVTLPADFPGFENENAVNGGLSSTLLGLCSNFDVPTDKKEIHYDEFLGCPSACTTFSFEGYAFMGRTFIKDTKCYTIVAGASKQDQSEAFINSFKFV